jgi:hypothetical protein
LFDPKKGLSVARARIKSPVARNSERKSKSRFEMQVRDSIAPLVFDAEPTE